MWVRFPPGTEIEPGSIDALAPSRTSLRRGFVYEAPCLRASFPPGTEIEPQFDLIRSLASFRGKGILLDDARTLPSRSGSNRTGSLTLRTPFSPILVSRSMNRNSFSAGIYARGQVIPDKKFSSKAVASGKALTRLTVSAGRIRSQRKVVKE